MRLASSVCGKGALHTKSENHEHGMSVWCLEEEGQKDCCVLGISMTNMVRVPKEEQRRKSTESQHVKSDTSPESIAIFYRLPSRGSSEERLKKSRAAETSTTTAQKPKTAAGGARAVVNLVRTTSSSRQKSDDKKIHESSQKAVGDACTTTASATEYSSSGAAKADTNSKSAGNETTVEESGKDAISSSPNKKGNDAVEEEEAKSAEQIEKEKKMNLEIYTKHKKRHLEFLEKLAQKRAIQQEAREVEMKERALREAKLRKRILAYTSAVVAQVKKGRVASGNKAEYSSLPSTGKRGADTAGKFAATLGHLQSQRRLPSRPSTTTPDCRQHANFRKGPTVRAPFDTTCSYQFNSSSSVYRSTISSMCGSPYTYDTEYLIWRRKHRLEDNRKVFSMTGGFDSIRQCLLDRGWYENTDAASNFFDLKWALRPRELNYKSLRPSQIVNHYDNVSSSLTTKAGLMVSLRTLHWYEDMDMMDIYPRSYDLSEEWDAFKLDFIWTASTSILRRIIQEKKLTKGGIPTLKVVQLAMETCRSNIRYTEHMIDKDHDDDIPPLPLSLNDDYIALMLDCPCFKDKEESSADASLANSEMPVDFEEVPNTVLAECEELLSRLKTFKGNQSVIDDTKNAWIIKPAGKSRGRGISCANSLSVIEERINSSEETSPRPTLSSGMWFKPAVEKRTEKWIAQKYIERPLVVKSRKFDIRQWVLVTNWNPLTIWFYNDCYLRFCAEDYSLGNLNNLYSHLSNNSIAKCSDNFANADATGTGNMWSNQTFIDWLRTQPGREKLWEERIDPAMRRCVVASLKCAQDAVENRNNSCELFGYDFMVDVEGNTWLIEINCSPSLEHSTPVTENLVSAMVSDLFKVLIDVPEEQRRRKSDGEGDQALSKYESGKWECILKGTKDNAGALPCFVGGSLELKGVGFKGPNHKKKKRRSSVELENEVIEINTMKKDRVSGNSDSGVDSDE